MSALSVKKPSIPVARKARISPSRSPGASGSVELRKSKGRKRTYVANPDSKVRSPYRRSDPIRQIRGARLRRDAALRSQVQVAACGVFQGFGWSDEALDEGRESLVAGLGGDAVQAHPGMGCGDGVPGR